MTAGEIGLLIWVLMGVAGGILRKDLREDAEVQSGLFPVFSWIGPMVGGMILGPVALLSGLFQGKR